MEPRLISTEKRDISDRLRAHGFDPEVFAYRIQPSTIITHYVRLAGRVLGRHEQAQAIALYPKARPGYFFTIEHDPRSGFRSSFCPSLANDSEASMQTWQEVMGLLDRWLARLDLYAPSTSRDMPLRQGSSASPAACRGVSKRSE